jgi:alanyl-tRNA synthetase
MNALQVRQSFLDFFAQRGHAVVPSASLLPTSPNLLFTNAGMNPFVPYFLGEGVAPHPRLADTQKCIRAGGKHNDLEDVGFDTYHHTFFEMLGNWSFGDYFKKEAIHWAWELITRVWHFPKQRLYATVYRPGPGDPASFDQEAYDLWAELFKKEGLDPDIHIRYGGKKDNFWMMGDTGPCGPCSELHVDLTPDGDTRGQWVNADSPYCLEIWNLVFIQFNAQEGGVLLPLKDKHVDTGMGLERVAGILANTKQFTDFSRPPSNYASDLFQDLFACISQASGKRYHHSLPQDRHAMTAVERDDCAFRVLADHIRTLSFAIADGILPGNEGRNYVLRRILRRAVLFGKRLGLQPGCLTALSRPLVQKMGPVFPELFARQSIIEKVLASEEAAFERTLDKGLQLLDKLMAQGRPLAGEDVFLLYDTYGFPADLTALIARERGLQVDSAGFEAAMEQQRQRARSAQKKTAIQVHEAEGTLEATAFVGYHTETLSNVQARLLACIPHENTQDNAQQNGSDGSSMYLVFDQTPFYAEMGGQVGDKGLAWVGTEPLSVQTTLKDKQGLVLHKVNGGPALYEALVAQIGHPVGLDVDLDHRWAITRHHSATHLLHWALRHTLGTHVQQAGSWVGPEGLRFDFSHFEALTPEQLQQVERLVNEKILANARVRTYEVPFAEKPAECLAFFADKYSGVVRVVDIGGYSLELCGGTHVEATGQIGLFKLKHESAIAAGVRRIEAVAGLEALGVVASLETQLRQLAQQLGCAVSQVSQRLEQVLEAKQTLEKQWRAAQQAGAQAQAKALVAQAFEGGQGARCVVAQVQADGPEGLRALALALAGQLGARSAVVLASSHPDKVHTVALCTAEAVQAGYHAGRLVQDLCQKLGGRGGGKPDFAMGAGKPGYPLDSLLANLAQHLRLMLAPNPSLC